MRRVFFCLMITLITSCSSNKNISRDLDERDLTENVDIISNNQLLLGYYVEYRNELASRGVFVNRTSFKIKYLFIEEGMTNGPNLKANNLQVYNNREKEYIIFSPDLLKDKQKLKKVVFEELTTNLGVIVYTKKHKDSNYDWFFDVVSKQLKQ
jgi:hypothetical protein